MNLEQAKKEFLEYTNKYDITNISIERKIGHSIRVMEISAKIAENLDLTQEQIELAALIGLLHDIGRFEQMKRYNTFKDLKSIDHGDLGVEILKKDNYIRSFIKEEIYDEIILKAIKNHNKYLIEPRLTDEQMLFARIIRDADKLDIFYEGVEMFWMQEKEIAEVEQNMISKEIFELFKEKRSINRNMVKNSTDGVVNFMSFIFDLNFEYSYKVLKQNDYINKIIDKFSFKHEETREQFEEIRNVAKKYITSYCNI